jgi:hypothetical protein
MHQEIPGLGTQYRIIFGGVCSGITRAVLECPFEYVKVKRQTGQTWEFRGFYKGFNVLLPRSIGILTYYFCVIDMIRRKTDLWNTKTGQFMSSGTAAMTAFWIVWPFEYLKNLA